MAYTVKQLAEMSGVSVRTLHFYDEVELLKPAWVGANGYRYYEEPQVLTLQQILFYRTLGLELKQIQLIMSRPDFDKLAALEAHHKVLRKSLADTRKLLRTIENTIEHLKGTKVMKMQEMFSGFDPEQQARHEQYLVDRYGDEARQSIAGSKRRVKDWTKADWEQSGGVFDALCRELVELMRGKAPVASRETQAVIRRHCEWLKQFWTPNRASYAGHSELILDSELRSAYEKYDPELPEYAAAAIREFAEAEME
jgi:DNA-binding transcriptional MerR regulator